MSGRHRRVSRGVCAGLALVASISLAVAAEDRASNCGPMPVPGQAGTYDYLKDRAGIEAIDRRSFPPKVEALVGSQSGSLGGDLTATLNASPNHHRALAAIMRLEEVRHVSGPPYMGSTIECFFEKAITFSPTDTVARGLYAVYLVRHRRVADAVRQLDAASALAGDDGMSHSSIGLVYLEAGQYDAASREAVLAAKYGDDSTVLVDKLKALDRWKEPAK